MINFAIVGLGFAQNYIKNLNLIPEANIKYICAKNPDSIKKLKYQPNNQNYKFTTDFMEICNDSEVDVIIIAIGPIEQKKLALYALDCNKHLILEKPLTLNYKDALEIKNVAKRTKKNIIVNYTDLWQPKYKDCCYFGSVSSAPRLIKCDFGGLGPIKNNYSPLWDWTSHPLALCINFNGNRIPKEYDIISWYNNSNENIYSIKLHSFPNDFWINVGNLFFDQKVRRFSIYTLGQTRTYEQFKTEFREQKYDSNSMLIMLEEYIDKLQKNEYHSNIDLACNVTYLLEKLEEKLK